MTQTSFDPIMKPVFLLILFLGAAISAAAQRPQGLGMHLEDVTSVGADLVGVANDGGSGSDGRVLRSTDGGRTFVELLTVPLAGDQLYTVAANANVVIASGTDSLFRRADFSFDPAAWTSINPPPGTFGDVFDLAANGTTWIAAGDATLRSTDNGQTWSAVSPVNTRAAAYNSADGSWLLVGGSFSAGKAYRSTNGGVSWTPAGLPVGAPSLSAVSADGFGNVLAVGEGGVFLISTDNGQTFTFAALGGASVSENLLDAVSTGENAWLVGGDQRTLFKLDAGAFDTVLPGVPAGGDTRGLALLDGAVVMAGIGVVPAPVISAPDSPSGIPVQVAITRDFSADGTFYTTDGSAPETGTEYAGTFTVSDTVTVLALSEAGGVYSPVSSLAVVGRALPVLGLEVTPTAVELTTDTSAPGTEIQLQQTADLSDPSGWGDVLSAKPGTGNPLTWTISPVPAGSVSWRLEIIDP